MNVAGIQDETNVDELGPVDWIVVEFPGSKFNGKIAPALADLVDRDLIRVLDRRVPAVQVGFRPQD